MANQFGDNTSAAVIRALYNAFVDEFNAHNAATNNPHAVTKQQVGLANVDNTSDVNKPASSAVIALLAGKYDGSNPTGYVTALEALNAVLVGFVTDSGAVSSSSTILQALQKLYGNQLTNTADILLKQNVAMAIVGSEDIKFDKPKMFGSVAVPRNGAAVTFDTTDAVVGVKCMMLHNAGAEPSYPAEFKKLNDSKNYQNSVLNYYEFQYFSATHITYRIYQEL